MSVSTSHIQYDAALRDWLRARHIIDGEDAVKAAGERYLPRLAEQTDEEYAAYLQRATFFNATARTAEGYIGMVFRRPPFIKLPKPVPYLDRGVWMMENDADLSGSPLASYAKDVLTQVISVGRCGTVIDWDSEREHRAYFALYEAEDILNWRVERVNGRNTLTLLVLRESCSAPLVCNLDDPSDQARFTTRVQPQIRVFELVPSPDNRSFQCRIQLWHPNSKSAGSAFSGTEWYLAETIFPRRYGQPLPQIPFVIHGPRNNGFSVAKPPLSDVIAVNLDHYRLDAQYKHGMHFTALPTAWLSGFDPAQTYRVGSTSAWIAPTTGADAGFLEFTGQGLTTFERAMDRDERLLAVLGARLLESQKRVGETAEAIELRQSGENSVLGSIAQSVGDSLTQALRWACWWHSSEVLPDHVTREQVLIELNTDYSTKGLTSNDIESIVAAWQAGALSRDSMTDLFRRGQVLPEGRTVEEEQALIQKCPAALPSEVLTDKSKTPERPLPAAPFETAA